MPFSHYRCCPEIPHVSVKDFSPWQQASDMVVGAGSWVNAIKRPSSGDSAVPWLEREHQYIFDKGCKESSGNGYGVWGEEDESIDYAVMANSPERRWYADFYIWLWLVVGLYSHAGKADARYQSVADTLPGRQRYYPCRKLRRIIRLHRDVVTVHRRRKSSSGWTPSLSSRRYNLNSINSRLQTLNWGSLYIVLSAPYWRYSTRWQENPVDYETFSK